jgi:translation initiation factor IF-1
MKAWQFSFCENGKHVANRLSEKMNAANFGH